MRDTRATVVIASTIPVCDRRIAEVGWDRASLGTVVRALGDGAWLGEYFDGQTRLPVMLRANAGETPEDLAQAPLITPSGEVVSLGELVTLERRWQPSRFDASIITAR